MLTDAEAAAAWGESVGQSARADHSHGSWSWSLTPDGVVDLAFAGQVLSPLITFSIRDLLWGTPALPFAQADDPLAFTAAAAGYPLVVTGSVEPGDRSIVLRFRVTASGETTVARCAPLMLHSPDSLAPAFEATFASGSMPVEAPARVDVARVVSGYTGVAFNVDRLRVTVDFEPGLFEMEDQRNWGDATFKSYTPPLGGPVLQFEAGEVRDFEVRIAVAEAPAGTAQGSESAPDSNAHPLPELGLAHRGGQLPEDAVALLAPLGIRYLHLLVDLSGADWKQRLEDDLGAAAQLGVDAVLSVDVAPDQHPLLAELAAVAAGRVSVAYVFDFALPCTSDELAAAAAEAFLGSGIAVGGGTRAYFADLSKIGEVPREVAAVAVSIGVASHANDRAALVGSLDSLRPTVSAARELAPGLPLLIGPLGFRTTFDSWGPIETSHDLNADWLAAHPRDGSEFAAAWMVAAVGELAEAGVDRVTIGATVGARGVLAEKHGRFEARPTLGALAALAESGGSVTASFLGEVPVIDVADHKE